ncbi:hypothetical protein ACWTU6_20070 [Mesorhizobium sp. BHbsci]
MAPLYDWSTVHALRGIRLEFDTDIRGAPVSIKNWPRLRDLLEKKTLSLPQYVNRPVAQNKIREFLLGLTSKTAVPYLLKDLDVAAACQGTDLPLGHELNSTDTTSNSSGVPFVNLRSHLLVGVDETARTATLKMRITSDADNLPGAIVDTIEKYNPDSKQMEWQTVRTDAAVHRSFDADCTVDIDGGTTRQIQYEEKLVAAARDRTNVYVDTWSITVRPAAK